MDDIRLAFRLDEDTKEMLRGLVDLDKGRNGKSTEGKVVIDLIREEHRQRFPDEWSGGIYKSYLRRVSA
jgi:hypothetical protein